MPRLIDAAIPANLVEYVADDVVFAAEYARWYERVESSDPVALPELVQAHERACGPSAYDSVLDPRAGETKGRSSKLHDAAATQSPALNDDLPLTDLKTTWMRFDLETTA